jgi:acyl-CoA synthetase (AMP-forming)/AMP-acid ligase II
MVKSGGISIYPLEIESVIYSHPDILEAAVIGVPDPQWGEALKAVIVLKPGGKLDSVELLSFCKERLAAYKVPKSVDFVESLPHTEVGKVNKVQVREMILRR